MNKMNKLGLGMVLLMAFMSLSVKAEIKPQWINNPPNPGNSSYVFKVVESEGEDLNSARSNSLKSLVSMIEHDDNIKIRESHRLTDEAERSNDKLIEANSNSIYVLEIENSINKTITTEKVAEYWDDFESNGHVRKRLNTLYMVQRKNQIADFDEIELTTKYGMKGFARSMIIPGWGQLYKGSKVKGGIILGGTVAGAIGIILTENTRADYIKKMHEQPKFANVYNSKASDWETSRNVCIGAVAALYIYNLIDAIVADGAERAIVKKRNNNFTFNPIISPDCGGILITYKF